MTEWTAITVSVEVKEEIDRQRQTPMGDVSVNDFLKYLLEKKARK